MAQKDVAAKKAAEQAGAALNAVRRGWRYLLLPQEALPDNANAARGFDLEVTPLSNRTGSPEPLPQVAWKKCETDHLVVSTLGVLDNDLGKVWRPDQPHVAVRQLRDWFAQFPYLSKLREPQVLARAISEALARSDARYAIADRYDETKNEYVGLKLGRLADVDLNSDALLVRADVAQAQLARDAERDKSTGGDTTGSDTSAQTRIVVQPSPLEPEQPRLPRRFYAKVTLDPNRPTPQVSNIAQSILSELDRVRGAKITLTLDIDAEAASGFPEDVESNVRANARDLRITDFGFEGE
jgi:hypothetical protein